MMTRLAPPRSYQGPEDLDAMRRILIAGRQAAGSVFYVHVGDLNWWLFYGEPETPHQIYLWAAEPGGEPVAWVLLSSWGTFDVFAHPAAVSPEQRRTLFTWAEERLAAQLGAEGRRRMDTIWISEHDITAIAHLTGRGFKRGPDDDLSFMARPLDDLGEPPPLPPGFEIRNVAGEHEVAVRAAPQHSAFESSWDMARYVARYRRFMQSPVYDPERDLMVLAPNGQAAAFCIYWLDPVNRHGHFEPMGTHADFHRLGLGKALLWEGLRRMQECGMETATVCPYTSNPAATGVYRSVGFQTVHQLLDFYKELT